MAGVDVLVVSLGATGGLRAADDALVASLRRAGAGVVIARAAPQPDVRTLALTDLRWALAARRAFARALREHGEPRTILCSTTTAALLLDRPPDAVRFDALAARTRPGRHGVWQRGRERAVLRATRVWVPWAEGSLAGAPSAPAADGSPVVVPPPIEASRDGVTPTGSSSPGSVVTYGAGSAKKGLDRVLAAWALVRRDGEELVVAGAPAPDGPPPPGVRYAGQLTPARWRALLRDASAFVTAPRREDFGIAQLEALAEGTPLVTGAAPGPYAALPIARALDPRFVIDAPDDPRALATALRAALDLPRAVRVSYATRARAAVASFSPAAVDALVAEHLLPRLLTR